MLPGIIFVFLKYAGKNEFNIPVYHETGVKDPPAICGLQYAVPYHLPKEVMMMTDQQHETNILIFPNEGLDAEKIQADIDSEFGGGKVWVKNAQLLTLNATEYDQLKICIFLLNDPWQSVLFDKQGKIRGYYDLRLRDEIDRLRVEVKILLKKY